MKRVHFQRDQSLIVIHAENGIEFAFDSTMKNRVRRVRPCYLGFRISDFGFQRRDSWADDFDFFTPKFA